MIRAFLTLLRRRPHHHRAAHADRRHRRANRHRIRARLRDRATDERKGTLDNRERRGPLIRLRIVDQLIEDHPAPFTKRECRAIGERHADARFCARLDHVALINLIALLQRDPGAIGPDRRHRALQGLDGADRLRLLDAAVRGELLRRGCPGHAADQVRGELGAPFGLQRRRVLHREVVADDDLFAVWPLDDEVGPFAGEVGHQQHRAAGNGERGGAGRVDDNGIRCPTQFAKLIGRKLAL